MSHHGEEGWSFGVGLPKLGTFKVGEPEACERCYGSGIISALHIEGVTHSSDWCSACHGKGWIVVEKSLVKELAQGTETVIAGGATRTNLQRIVEEQKAKEKAENETKWKSRLVEIEAQLIAAAQMKRTSCLVTFSGLDEYTYIREALSTLSFGAYEKCRIGGQTIVSWEN